MPSKENASANLILQHCRHIHLQRCKWEYKVQDSGDSDPMSRSLQKPPNTTFQLPVSWMSQSGHGAEATIIALVDDLLSIHI